MDRFFLPIIAALIFFACQPEKVTTNPFNWQKQKAAFFNQFVNQTVAPEKFSDKALTLVNHSYPIKITLYKDGKFHYFLERLNEVGESPEGVGTWTYDDGRLRLVAEVHIFEMKINVRSISDVTNEIALDFVDRFETRFLQLAVE
jgi:hypothetical protein